MRKGKIALIAGAGIGAVLLILATVLLIKGNSDFKRKGDQLEVDELNLRSFYDLAPFPSKENVARELANVKMLESKFDELAGQLRAGNVRSGLITPASFVRAAGGLRTQMRTYARTNGVVVAADFGYGFSFYIGTGTLPKPTHAQRLTTQLLMVNRLARMLCDAKVKSITDIGRDRFDNPTASAGAPAAGLHSFAPSMPGQGGFKPPKVKKSSSKRRKPAEEKLYQTERFNLVFTATEESLLELLNALATSEMFCVVRSVTVKKAIPALDAPAAGGAISSSAATAAPASPAASAIPAAFAGLGLLPETPAAPVAPAAPAGQKSVFVCGVEREVPMTVTVQVDVYNFVGGEESGGDDER